MREDLCVLVAKGAEEVADGGGGQAEHGPSREHVDGPALGGPLQVHHRGQPLGDGGLQDPHVLALVLHQPAGTVGGLLASG